LYTSARTAAFITLLGVNKEEVNMNYELAKKLKEAGFPEAEMTEERELVHITERCVANNPAECTLIIPTLSELIEACGKRYIKIEKHYAKNPLQYISDEKIIWFEASADDKDIHTGKTPEEAVASLYLALNNK
jgi:hypothetical protein